MGRAPKGKDLSNHIGIFRGELLVFREGKNHPFLSKDISLPKPTTSPPIKGGKGRYICTFLSLPWDPSLIKQGAKSYVMHVFFYSQFGRDMEGNTSNGGRHTSNVIQIVCFLFQVDTNCLHDNTGWLKGILPTAEYTPYNR